MTEDFLNGAIVDIRIDFSPLVVPRIEFDRPIKPPLLVGLMIVSAGFATA